VAEVSEEGPAGKAGLRSGDIIVTFDGKTIPTSADLPHVVGLVAPGTTVDVEIVRDKKRQSMRVEVGGLDADESYSLAAGKSAGNRPGRLGMEVEMLPAESLERFGINGGVVVRKVAPGSVAAESGIRVDDIITLIDTTPIKSIEAFERAVDALKGGSSVPLRLIRRGSPLFIGLRLPD
jgi:serine protease Do